MDDCSASIHASNGTTSAAPMGCCSQGKQAAVSVGDEVSGRVQNIAVVGLGYWGPNRLRALIDIEGVDVTWICDRDESRFAKLENRHPNVRSTTDIDELLADDELDAVVLATPVFTHHSLTSAALRAGKHVFVEKPLAASSGEANDLFSIAAECERTLMLSLIHI